MGLFEIIPHLCGRDGYDLAVHPSLDPVLIGHPLAELVHIVPHSLGLGVEQVHTVPETKVKRWLTHQAQSSATKLDSQCTSVQCAEVCVYEEVNVFQASDGALRCLQEAEEVRIACKLICDKRGALKGTCAAIARCLW